MKMLKKMIWMQLLALGLLMSGCYNDFDDPAREKPATDADFETIVPISDVKQLFYDVYGKGAGGVGKGVVVEKDWVIKGKVISSDAAGNIYRTMYIQDESGAIEVKLGISGIYNEYKVGQIVYVKVKDLVLGSYRYMLSLGAASVDADYANGYMDVRTYINAHVFKGELVGMTKVDTLVVNSPSELNDNDLGRLVRINGLTSYFGDYDGDKYPSFLESLPQEVGEPIYNNYSYVDVISDWKAYRENPAEVAKPSAPDPGEDVTVPTYAYSNNGNKYYGTACFELAGKYYLLRSSGYSRFALEPLPAHGKKVNITAIYTKYSSRTGGFIKYQLVLNNVNDVVTLY